MKDLEWSPCQHLNPQCREQRNGPLAEWKRDFIGEENQFDQYLKRTATKSWLGRKDAYVPVCPVTAILVMDDLPENCHAYIEANKKHVDGGKYQPEKWLKPSNRRLA